MKTLVLQIENVPTLENGGPVSLTVAGRLARVGRKTGMDWVLPDSSRHISGHHFDVSPRGDGYVLEDVSSNGTFIQGERYRMSGPHEIRDGDRFTVGHYIIRAELRDAAAPPGPEPVPTPAAAPGPGPELAPAPAPAPTPLPTPVPSLTPDPLPEQPLAPPEQAPLPGVATSAPPLQTPSFPPTPNAEDPFDDVWGDAAPSDPSPAATPQSAGLSTPPFGAASIQEPSNFGSVAPPAAETTGLRAPDFSKIDQTSAPTGLSMPPGAVSQLAHAAQPAQPQPLPAVPPSPGQPQSPPPQPAAAPAWSPPPAPNAPPPPSPVPAAAPSYAGAPVASGTSGDDIMRAFLEGAQVSDPSLLEIPPAELARMLGRVARVGTQQMMLMLQERAAVKLFISGEDRTLLGAMGNNPMKFMIENPEQAFEIMFLKPREGYMTGDKGFENALNDIRKHQKAMMAALQPALAEMLDGLSPDDIEDEVGGRRIAGGSRKLWDEYAKRWETRAAQGENGMLDAFLRALSRHYTDAVRKL